MRTNKNIIFNVFSLSLIYLANTSITAYGQQSSRVNDELLQQEIDRLKALDSVHQNDISLSFFVLIEDCIRDDIINDTTIIACQVAVYVSLGLEIERQLGIDMETDNGFEGKPPQIEDEIK